MRIRDEHVDKSLFESTRTYPKRVFQFYFSLAQIRFPATYSPILNIVPRYTNCLSCLLTQIAKCTNKTQVPSLQPRVTIMKVNLRHFRCYGRVQSEHFRKIRVQIERITLLYYNDGYVLLYCAPVNVYHPLLFHNFKGRRAKKKEKEINYQIFHFINQSTN